jgi:hypothetical protein
VWLQHKAHIHHWRHHSQHPTPQRSAGTQAHTHRHTRKHARTGAHAQAHTQAHARTRTWCEAPGRVGVWQQLYTHRAAAGLVRSRRQRQRQLHAWVRVCVCECQRCVCDVQGVRGTHMMCGCAQGVECASDNATACIRAGSQHLLRLCNKPCAKRTAHTAHAAEAHAATAHAAM